MPLDGGNPGVLFQRLSLVFSCRVGFWERRLAFRASFDSLKLGALT